MSVILYQFQTVKFIQMMSLTFGLFTQVSGSGPLGPLVCKKPYDKNVVTPEKIERVWLPLTQIFFCLPKLLTEMPED